MAITDELREYAQRYKNSHDAWSGIGNDLDQIADLIDAEYERMFRALTIDAKPMTDESMAEHGWVKLPVDADGVPIRIGDVIDEIAVATYPFVPAKVVGYHECCGEVLPIVENDGEFQVIPEKVCHHHAPTVEDVLRDLLEEHSDPTCDATPSELAEKYAAKLRLAEEVDE